MKSDLDCYNEKNIKCPYCYQECEDDSYRVVNNSNGNYVNFQCENCGKDFKVLANVEITYTTARIDEDGDVVETWQDIEEGDCKYGYCDCIFTGCSMCSHCVDGNHYDDEDK